MDGEKLWVGGLWFFVCMCVCFGGSMVGERGDSRMEWCVVIVWRQ